MKFKQQNKRGTTLAEVLLVVALIAVMLGIAVPNVFAASQKTRMMEMNSNARAVAIAVQSKLYGMKNAATSTDKSYYEWLNDTAATEADIHLTSAQDSGETEIYFQFRGGKRGILPWDLRSISNSPRSTIRIKRRA